MADDPPLVRIHYQRPPEREDVFVQHLLHQDARVRITFEPALPIPAPKSIHGQPAMEPGSPVLWFTFPDTWHDIGLFHLADDTFTGVYANILTPPVFADRHTWYTTDLFLDVWIPAGGDLRVLDRDQFRQAVAEGALSAAQEAGALAEVARIERDARAGLWPPPIVGEWDLARARAACRDRG